MPAAATEDGISISYESAGTGPPNLLCLHGWAGSGRYFDETIGQLDLTRVRAVTFDLRGHGDSESRDDYTLDRIAADSLAVADAAGLDDFVVLGFSMSAKFGQYLALTAPERVRGLILLAGCPVGEISLPRELTDDWLSREGDARRMAEIAETYSSNPIAPHLLERFGQDAARVGPTALQGTLHAAIATSFADRVGEILMPTFVVGGVHDAMFPPDLLRDAVAAPIPGARLALLDAGHEIALEVPQQLAALIEAFLAGMRAGSGAEVGSFEAARVARAFAGRMSATSVATSRSSDASVSSASRDVTDDLTRCGRI